MWSLGVILYVLLCQHLPFWDNDDAQIYQAILQGRYDTKSGAWLNISAQGIHLVRSMLCLDPRRRITLPQVLGTPPLDTPSLGCRSLARLHRAILPGVPLGKSVAVVSPALGSSSPRIPCGLPAELWAVLLTLCLALGCLVACRAPVDRAKPAARPLWPPPSHTGAAGHEALPEATRYRPHRRGHDGNPQAHLLHDVLATHIKQRSRGEARHSTPPRQRWSCGRCCCRSLRVVIEGAYQCIHSCHCIFWVQV